MAKPVYELLYAIPQLSDRPREPRAIGTKSVPSWPASSTASTRPKKALVTFLHGHRDVSFLEGQLRDGARRFEPSSGPAQAPSACPSASRNPFDADLLDFFNRFFANGHDGVTRRASLFGFRPEFGSIMRKRPADPGLRSQRRSLATRLSVAPADHGRVAEIAHHQRALTWEHARRIDAIRHGTAGLRCLRPASSASFPLPAAGEAEVYRLLVPFSS